MFLVVVCNFHDTVFLMNASDLRMYGKQDFWYNLPHSHKATAITIAQFSQINSNLRKEIHLIKVNLH